MKKIVFLVVVMILTTNVLSAATQSKYIGLYNFIVKFIEGNVSLNKGEVFKVDGFTFIGEEGRIKAVKQYATGDYSVRDDIFEEIRTNVIEKLNKKYTNSEIEYSEILAQSEYYGGGLTLTSYGSEINQFKVNNKNKEVWFCVDLGGKRTEYEATTTRPADISILLWYELRE